MTSESSADGRIVCTAGGGTSWLAMSRRCMNVPTRRCRDGQMSQVARCQSSFHLDDVSTVKPQVVDDVVAILLAHDAPHKLMSC